MAVFDFINDEDFRKSLESDYDEMEKCMGIGAWKAVHVLAGSIIEALLLDYLVVIEYDKRSSRRLSDLKLVEIINICKNEQILNNRTADLSNVIRDYRNLIHPEKIRRLNEKVDKNGAQVAEALVKIIIEDVSDLRSKKVGLTAEQLITKIENDYSVGAILEHLVKNLSRHERKRLLENILLERYLKAINGNVPTDNEPMIESIRENLETCFHLTFNLVADNVKKEIAQEFIRVIKNESSAIVTIYEEGFFQGEYLAYFSSEDQQLFKRHFLARLNNNFNTKLVNAAKGMSKFLNESDVTPFVSGFIRGIMVDDANEGAKEVFADELSKMDSDTQSIALEKIDEWIQELENKRFFQPAHIIRELKEGISVRSLFSEVVDDYDPFLEENDLP